MQLKGINFGSWLLMEGYILGGRNIPESIFKKNFAKINGKSGLREFEKLFRGNFINEIDFHNVALMGANCIRLPFNYRLIQNKECDGIKYLKKALFYAKKYNLGVILDMHAAPGAQNCDWHSDSLGTAMFWEKDKLRAEALDLWERIIDECKNETALIGYDIINEPVLDKKPPAVLIKFYKDAIKRVRAIDGQRIIFLEGDIWAQRIDFLKELTGENISISIHTYQPLNYTFNFSPFHKFPGRIDKVLWNNDKIKKYLEPYFLFSKKNNTHIFVGEFGINWRGGHWGELCWLKNMLETFEEFNFSYTYWTYKAISGYLFPDGLYQFIPNSRFISREGPVYGWENYTALWKKNKKEIKSFLQTKNFTPNNSIISLLKKFFLK